MFQNCNIISLIKYKPNRLYAVRNGVRYLDGLVAFVARKRHLYDGLGEFTRRLVASEDTDHLAACRTLLLTTAEIFSDAAGTETVSAGQFPWLSDVIHTDNTMCVVRCAILCCRSSRC